MSNFRLKEAVRAATPDDTIERQKSRDQIIVRTSVIGILANVMLAVFKAVIGAVTGSIAITMDAVNNLSDAGASLITIVGTKLASRPADKKHPFGYGRIEYLSAMIISVIVLYAGITSFEESVKKIIHPEVPDYSVISLVIIAVAVVVKIVLGRFVKKTGMKVNSESLVNSGQDAILDSVISFSTLLAALIFILFHFPVEAWLGAFISLVIIKSGVEMLRSTLSQILGEGAGVELSKKIISTINAFPEVVGAFDLVLNNYGPDSYLGSVHIEVADTMTVVELDALIRRITDKVLEETQVGLTAISAYSFNTSDPKAAALRDKIQEEAMANEHVLQVHGFYLDEVEKTIRFDMIISYEAGDRDALYRKIVKKFQEEYPDYQMIIAMDTSFT